MDKRKIALGGTVTALVLAGAASAAADARGGPRQHRLDGTWYNELCSVMHLRTTPDGNVTGDYESLVGNAKGKYALNGRYDTEPPAGKGQTVGWTVSWRNDRLNSHSLTTWSGQYFGDGGERIHTQWLLTTSSTAQDQWGSTRIGPNTFVRKRPPQCTGK
ncbi:hypothetical protein AGRA3207_004987 [Actinomadura graeca]|uniref:Avidin family protein n=1 Tax=Actinomadura graeca TaxID=2750812 RepID=A0ABX8QY62_9ACTN|nr:avidin/streptavidin family protein [Actinomadura graeca]QXJ23785.1 hypothetical protein AGRA3207_004987 [Actinomadura graeca]